MDAKGRNEEPSLLEKDWKIQGYTHPLTDEPMGSELTNDIHHMFSFKLDESPRPERSKARWNTLTREEYEFLDQPLRLGTQWLESAPSSDAICSIIGGDRNIPSDRPMHKGLVVSEFHQHTLPASAVLATARNALERLAKSISFDFVDNLDDHGRTGAVCLENHFGDGVEITDRPGFRGLASITRINRVYLTTLRLLLRDRGNNKFQILKLYFELALTISHEVIHAVDLAVESKLLDVYKDMDFASYLKIPVEHRKAFFVEPFYEGERQAELGCFWENKVFGGICMQSPSNPANPLRLTEWPVKIWVLSYDLCACRLYHQISMGSKTSPRRF